MTFSENFAAGRVPQGPQPNRQPLPTASDMRAHLEDNAAEARRITGQVAPGDAIPQLPPPPPMSNDQSMDMLAQSIAVIAGQATRMTTALETMEKRQAKILTVLEGIQETQTGTAGQASMVQDIHDLVRGFTDDGASFRSSVADPFTVAYSSVVSPMLAILLRDKIDGKPIADLLKAGNAMARDMVEEMAAYREQRPATAALEQALGASEDPWGALGK